jgi:DNA-binding helix-hairpin-helix protein with protein kinase domain
MDKLTCRSGKNYIIAQQPFAKGGEGGIFDITNYGGYVAKIYYEVSDELEKKIIHMYDKKPSVEVRSQIAWPEDTLYSNGKFCGFVSNKLSITDELKDIYKYPSVQPISVRQKLVIAMKICDVIKAVHEAGYVFGDFNPRNIGVNIQSGMVAFFDTDSYHIVLDKKFNSAYRCKVCLDGYVAPELLIKISQENLVDRVYELATLDTFTQHTDNFALAIHIFKLMMNGYFPFNGIKEADSASQATPGIGSEAVKRDNYCFKPGNKPLAVTVLKKTDLPDYILNLFNRAFIDGRKDPAKRPDADEWYSALTNYESNLKQCKNNENHQYFNSLSSCPYCEADKRFETEMKK